MPEFLLQYREVPSATCAPSKSKRILSVHVDKPFAAMPTVCFQEAIEQHYEPHMISAFPLSAASDQQPASLFEKPTKPAKSRLHRHLNETKALEEQVEDDTSGESVERVLSCYAHQKKLFLEDIRALSAVFWRRATYLWEQANPDLAPFGSQVEVSANVHELLLGELSLVRNLEKQLERKQQPKPRRPSAATRNVLSYKR